MLIRSLGRRRRRHLGVISGTIDEDDARAAHAMLAREVRSGEAEVVSEYVGQQHAMFDLHFVVLATIPVIAAGGSTSRSPAR